MKKIFTLLMFAGICYNANAQSRNAETDYDRKNDVAYHDTRNERSYNDHFGSRKRDLERQVAGINRFYETKIENVKCNLMIPRFKKNRLINELKQERNDRIRDAYARFNVRNNRYDYRKGW